MAITRTTGTFFGPTKNNASTTITAGANNATQTLGSTSGMSIGDSLYFATAGVYRFVQSITNSTTCVLTAAVNSTTSETVTRALANNTTMTSAALDLLGNASSIGDILVYADITATATIGTIDFYIESQSAPSSSYALPGGSPSLSIVPVNGTQSVFLGRYQPDRYCVASIVNNATGAPATVSLNYTLEQMS